MEGAKLSKKDSRKFILGGNALVTFKSLATNKHYTYRVKKSDNSNMWFVAVSHGNGGNDDSYIGSIYADMSFRHTKGSKVGEDAESFVAFKWVWYHIDNEQIEVWHEGKCGRCGRTLTEPESIKRGFGPICIGLI